MGRRRKTILVTLLSGAAIVAWPLAALGKVGCDPSRFLDAKDAEAAWASSRAKVGKRPAELASFDRRLSIRSLNPDADLPIPAATKAHLSGYELAPAVAPRGAVVVFPGNAMWCRTALIALRHVTTDLKLVCFDYRTQDGSRGELTTANLLSDARAILTTEQARLAPGQDLFVLGLSFGGIVAANAIPKSSVRRAIIDSSFAEVGLGCPTSLDPIRALPMAGVPVLVAIGSRDRSMIKTEKDKWRSAKTELVKSGVTVREFAGLAHLVSFQAAVGDSPAARIWIDRFLAPRP